MPGDGGLHQRQRFENASCLFVTALGIEHLAEHLQRNRMLMVRPQYLQTLRLGGCEPSHGHILPRQRNQNVGFALQARRPCYLAGSPGCARPYAAATTAPTRSPMRFPTSVELR
jgi:hypothetical protein